MRIFSGVSGTSCDGISWSLVDVGERRGKISFRMLDSGSRKYSAKLRHSLLDGANTGKVTLADLCDMHWAIGSHLARIAANLKPVPEAAVFSGHTMFHTEQVGKTGKGTFQIGAVEPLSVELGIPAMCDMRSTDVAAGGMGAPLVPRADEIMFGRGSAVLNMGGISNITLLGRRTTGFDTGPGNMLIDEAARKLFGKEMDSQGKIAFSGNVNEEMLSQLLKDAFVNARPPKSCGRERYGAEFFSRLLDNAQESKMSGEDVVATVSEFTVRSILRNMELFAPEYRKLICAGGGSFNRYLTSRLKKLFGGSLHMSDEFGVPRDSRESLAFALMCYLSLKLEASNSDATGARIKLPLGKVTAFGFGGSLLKCMK